LAGPGGNLRPGTDAQQLIDNRLSGQKPYNQALYVYPSKRKK